VGFEMPDAGVSDAGVYDDAGPGFTTVGGCGCRTAGHAPSAPWAGVLVGVAALAILRKRKR
jgi:MYXO-CTERM domain-containing protein